MPLLALPFPAIDPVLIQIGPFAIRWYALAYIVGLVLGWQYLRWLVRRPGLAADARSSSTTSCSTSRSASCSAGGSATSCSTGRTSTSANPLEILTVWQGGMSFHGGLLGVVAACALFARRRGLPILEVGDAIACAAPIGLFLGRLANFINGELWGRISDVPWAMVFPGGGPAAAPPEPALRGGARGRAAVRWS